MRLMGTLYHTSDPSLCIISVQEYCQNLGASNRTPVRIQTQVEQTIGGRKEERGVFERDERNTRNTLLSFLA